MNNNIVGSCVRILPKNRKRREEMDVVETDHGIYILIIKSRTIFYGIRKGSKNIFIISSISPLKSRL